MTDMQEALRLDKNHTEPFLRVIDVNARWAARETLNDRFVRIVKHVLATSGFERCAYVFLRVWGQRLGGETPLLDMKAELLRCFSQTHAVHFVPYSFGSRCIIERARVQTTPTEECHWLALLLPYHYAYKGTLYIHSINYLNKPPFTRPLVQLQWGAVRIAVTHLDDAPFFSYKQIRAMRECFQRDVSGYERRILICSADFDAISDSKFPTLESLEACQERARIMEYGRFDNCVPRRDSKHNNAFFLGDSKKYGSFHGLVNKHVPRASNEVTDLEHIRNCQHVFLDRVNPHVDLCVQLEPIQQHDDDSIEVVWDVEQLCDPSITATEHVPLALACDSSMR